MDEYSLETIEYELTVFVRRVLLSEKKNDKLDRSAYLLLRLLSTQGPSGVKALANELHLDISTISRQAAALEQKGYVTKIPNPEDGRAYFYQITESGTKEFVENRKKRFETLSKILREWSTEERRQLGELLSKYNKSARETF